MNTEEDRLSRVTLNLLIEPGHPGIHDLVDQFGAEATVAVLESDRHGRLFRTGVYRRREHINPVVALEGPRSRAKNAEGAPRIHQSNSRCRM